MKGASLTCCSARRRAASGRLQHQHSVRSGGKTTQLTSLHSLKPSSRSNSAVKPMHSDSQMVVVTG